MFGTQACKCISTLPLECFPESQLLSLISCLSSSHLGVPHWFLETFSDSREDLRGSTGRGVQPWSPGALSLWSMMDLLFIFCPWPEWILGYWIIFLYILIYAGRLGCLIRSWGELFHCRFLDLEETPLVSQHGWIPCQAHLVWQGCVGLLSICSRKGRRRSFNLGLMGGRWCRWDKGRRRHENQRQETGRRERLDPRLRSLSLAHNAGKARPDLPSDVCW